MALAVVLAGTALVSGSPDSAVAVALLAGVFLALLYVLAAVLAVPSALAGGLGSVLRRELSRSTRTWRR